MLTRLYVDNFRCLVNFEFKPTNKQLIIGRNGAGKSTALDILSLLRDFSINGLPCENQLLGETKTRWQPDVALQSFELDAKIGADEYHYQLMIDEWGKPRRPRVKQESVVCSGNQVFLFEVGKVHLFNDKHEDKVQYEFDWHRSALATIAERLDNKKLTLFKRWFRHILHLQINPWMMSARSEKESREPVKDLSNFADWYRHLLLDSSSAVYKAISDLKEAIPGLETIDAKEAGLNVRVVQAAIRAERDSRDSQFAFHDLSEGQRALIALYVVLHCRVTRNATILIDEPDNFIALPEIQPWLMKLLDRVEEQNAQVILVSHHPELLDQLAGQGGVIFDRPGGGATRVLPFQPADTGLTPAEFIARGWDRA